MENIEHNFNNETNEEKTIDLENSTFENYKGTEAEPAAKLDMSFRELYKK